MTDNKNATPEAAPVGGQAVALADRITHAIAGTTVWQAMNRDETGFCMEWAPSEYSNPQRACERWFSEQDAAWIERNGYHPVKVVVFTGAERLALEAAVVLRALAASPAPTQPAETFAEWQWRFANEHDRAPTARDAFDAAAPSQPVAAPGAAQEVPSTEAYDQSLYLDVINYGHARRDGNANAAASWMRQIIRRIEAMSTSAPAAPAQSTKVAGVSLVGAHDAHPAPVRMPTSFAWPADIAAQSAAPQQSAPTQSDAAPVGGVVPKWQVSDERIKRLMERVGMPNSMSLYQAFKQHEIEILAPHPTRKLRRHRWRTNQACPIW
jgi:hypothetical protein